MTIREVRAALTALLKQAAPGVPVSKSDTDKPVVRPSFKIDIFPAEGNAACGGARERSLDVDIWYYPAERVEYLEECSEMAERLIGELGIVTPGVDTPVRMMSGGNVQKVLLGREIESSPQVLITAYPVRGLDINSSYLIYDLLNQQKKKGVAVVYIGEDLDVLLELSDRIMVLCHGKITGIVDAKKLTKEQLGLMMTGTEAGELGLDKSMASEKKEEQA